MKALTDSKIRADQLRAKIAKLEAHYDGLFGVYLIFGSLGQELVGVNMKPLV